MLRPGLIRLGAEGSGTRLTYMMLNHLKNQDREQIWKSWWREPGEALKEKIALGTE